MLHCKHAEKAWVSCRLGDRGATYAVGDRVADDIPPEEIDDVCLKVKDAKPDEPVRILLASHCGHCKLTNFAQVVLADGHVRSIDTIELNPQTLAQLHYIAEDNYEMLEILIGESIYNESGIRPDWLGMLSRALDSGRRW